MLAGVLIVVSTLPWDLRDHPHIYKISWIPFLSGHVRPLDLLANLALYFPFGYFFPAGVRRRLLCAAGAGLLLSAAMETAQVWSHVRFPSATDIVMNVAGCLAGALVSAGYRVRAQATPVKAAQGETTSG